MYRVLIHAVLLGIVAVSVGAMDEMTFTRMVADSISQRVPSSEVEVVDTLRLVLRMPGSRETQLGLYRAYIHWTMDSSALGRFLQVWTTPEPYAPLGAMRIERNIVPVVWGKEWVENASGLARIVWEPLNEELRIVYAVDDSLSIRYLQPAEVESLNVDLFILREFAICNLRQLIPETLQIAELGEKTYGVVAGANYESSLLLLDELWLDGETFVVDGDPVVAVPDREILVVTGSADSLGLEILKRAVAEGIVMVDRPVSKKLFTLRNHKWEVWTGE